MACACILGRHRTRRIVLTGGPGAGKTAVLETVRRHFCEHVVVLPEAASIVFGGGFPREASAQARAAAQRAILHVQRQLERWATETRNAAVVVCDRGTVDGLAYWPFVEEDPLAELGTDHRSELARYDRVIHLRPPPAEDGYDHSNPLRTEDAAEAQAIDARIEAAWAAHPQRTFVPSTHDFLEKVTATLERIREEVPPCCR